MHRRRACELALVVLLSCSIGSAAADRVSGNIRFFGPLSSGCQVTYEPPAPPTTTTLGGVDAPPNTTVFISHCTDAFTGVPIPYAVAGVAHASGRFQVSSTNTIAAASDLDHQHANAGVSYARMGNFDNDANNTDDSTDVFTMMKQGQIRRAERMLVSDLQFMAVSNLVIQAIMNATNGTGTPTCNSTSALQFALASWIANQTVFAPTSPAAVNKAFQFFTNEPCLVPQTVVASAGRAEVINATLTLAGLAHGFGSWPLYDVVLMARLSSFVATTNISYILSLNLTNYDNLSIALDQSPLVPGQICATLGIDGYTVATVSMTVSSAGPLSGVKPVYTPFTHLTNSTLDATDDDGILTIDNHTLGSYTIPAGAVDTFLTTDPSHPVVTLVPILGVAPFVSGNISMSPVAALVLANYTMHQGDGFAPAVPSPGHWRQAYEAILNASLPDNDYLARDYTPGSSTHLSVSAMDTMLQSLPSVGGFFAIKVMNHSDPSEVVTQIFSSMVGMNASSLTDTPTVYGLMLETMVQSAFNAVGMSHHTRRLLQTSSTSASFSTSTSSTSTSSTSTTLSTILLSISSSIAATNSLAGSILVQAQLSLATGGTPGVSLFYQLAQIAQVQSTSLASAIDNIANLIASGDLAGATAAATNLQNTYTGASLKALVDAAPVNTAAINSATGNTSGSSNHGLAVGLGVGLGVGIPLVALAAIGTMMYVKKRRAAQATAPAPPADPTQV